MKLAAILAAATLMLASTAAAQSVAVGTYLCTVEQTASIGSTHVEDARPPSASTNNELYRFRLSVSDAPDGRLRVVEVPYDATDSSRYLWEDDNSTLHSAYRGDGRAFNAEGAPGFLNFGRDRWGDALQFYHSGFQYAGGEDESVAVRWGRCAPE